MAEKPTRDDVLRRMLKTPPTPHDRQPKVRGSEVEKQLKELDDAIGKKDRRWTKDGLPKLK